MKLFRWKQYLVLSASGLMVLASFQNCSPANFKALESEVSSLDDANALGGQDLASEIDFADSNDSMDGSSGDNTIDNGSNHNVSDNSSDSDPLNGFEEVFVLDENVEEEYVEKTIRSSWECRFVLRGEQGAEWSVIRYNATGDCALEESTVRSNNPKATIISKSTVFVKDPTGASSPMTDHWACNFTLKGAQGNTWSVIRNVTAKGDCTAQIPIVKSNNPNASIIKQTVTFVSVATQSKSKWMCYYTLKGQKGYVWTSERESTDSKSCATQTAIVKANNPKATITKIVGPSFVKL